MSLSHIFIICSFLCSCICFSQERHTAEFGKPSDRDFSINIYEKDTTAAAVVLFEQGYYYYDKVGSSIKLIKQVHCKIKVFDSKRFYGGTVDVPLSFSDGGGERITGYRALIHNQHMKTNIDKNGVFIASDENVGPVFRMVFPNIKDGSILEYIYKIESPFLFNFYGWEFQGELPKIYSEFLFKIPIDFQFNNVLYGDQKLYLNKSQIVDDCLQTNYNATILRCPMTLYAMIDIPAFREEEFMLSPKNYISRVEFEPKELRTSAGWKEVKKFSTTWKDVDKLFKKENSWGKQLNKSSYFKRRLPDSILSISSDIDRAMAVYKFIQNHFAWDGQYYNSEMTVKDAFDQKKGSVPEITLSLINALEAARLDVKLMLLSTRENGLPTELYPVMSKFNYTLAFLTIEGKSYLLDATSKQGSFGIIPFQALNIQGRVMDFRKGSYWHPIEPIKQNIHYVNAQIKAQKNGDFKGLVNQSSYGYLALEKRKIIEDLGSERYIQEEQRGRGDKEIENLEIVDLTEIEKPLKENYHISIEPEIVEDKIILYPFFNKTYFDENPFKMEKRMYPLDFGYPITNTYLVSIDVGNVYEIDQLPKSRSIKLPHDDGECSVTYISEGTKVNIRFNLKLNTFHYQPDAYPSLKEFFGTMITMLKEEPITLRKL